MATCYNNVITNRLFKLTNEPNHLYVTSSLVELFEAIDTYSTNTMSHASENAFWGMSQILTDFERSSNNIDLSQESIGSILDYMILNNKTYDVDLMKWLKGNIVGYSFPEYFSCKPRFTTPVFKTFDYLNQHNYKVLSKQFLDICLEHDISHDSCTYAVMKKIKYCEDKKYDALFKLLDKTL